MIQKFTQHVLEGKSVVAEDLWEPWRIKSTDKWLQFFLKSYIFIN